MRMVRITMRATMIVCVCHRVSDRDIAHAVRAGCGSFDELQDELRVATACGACGDCARETFDRQHAPTPRSMAACWVRIEAAPAARGRAGQVAEVA
jgi:bacterioferritin-associated ferredoxin